MCKKQVFLNQIQERGRKDILFIRMFSQWFSATNSESEERLQFIDSTARNVLIER